MIVVIRKRLRIVVSFLLFLFCQFLSLETYALTSGPAQEEYASFEPIGTTEMVDLYSGDFTYNIPLLSVPGPNGGYPINLAYHSGIGMDQEASWVGLGWNVNVGAINRSLRGLPDDFKGDVIEQKKHLRESFSVGVDLFNNSAEFIGISSNPSDYNPHNIQTQVYYNNYKGLGYRFKIQPKFLAFQDGGLSGGLGLSVDSQEGVGIDANFSVGATFFKKSNTPTSMGVGINGSVNSRQGLQFGYTSKAGVGFPVTKEGISVPVDVNLRPFGIPMSFKSSFNYMPSGSGSMGSGVSFAFNHGVPSVQVPMENKTYTYDLKMGFGTNLAPPRGVGPPLTMRSSFPLNWTGMYSTSKVSNDGDISVRGYGYMHTGNASDKDMTDFSHAPVTFNRKLPYVTPSSVNHDIFSISGQGTGGAFRAHRDDIGIYSPQRMVSRNKSYPLNLEVGVNASPYGLPPPPFVCPVWYYAGLGTVPVGFSQTVSGGWDGQDINSQVGTLGFTPSYDGNNLLVTDENSLAETAYFKQIGNSGAILGNNTQYDQWDGEDPLRIKLQRNVGSSRFKTDGIEDQSGNTINTAGNGFAKLDERQSRTNVLQKLTAAEARKYGMSKNLVVLDPATEEFNRKFPEDENDPLPAHMKDHHISEIVQLQTDGTRYIYGLPSYNLTQEDATFSVSKNTNDYSTRITDVPPSPGYPVGNGAFSREQEFLDKTNLPSYVNSWMLTGVVSSDYVDRTGDGITEDDYGYWVMFDYKKTSSDYHWRVPFSGANYSPGTEDPFDDRGAYSKGTKELHYLYRIRTKTHVAVFKTLPRNDGHGAASGDQGGLSTDPKNTMHKLDKISLYTVDEYDNGGADEPLKVVHFRYKSSANELCEFTSPKNRNGAGGKLTLDKVYFTYGASNKGELSPYQFFYEGANHDYSEINNDCWGNYKDNQAYNSDYPFDRFPYTEQDPAHRESGSAWNLTKINLPTGGELNIDYEQDDYAYVEDKKAMQMFDIVHVGDNISTNMAVIPDRWGTGGPTLGSLDNPDNTQNPYRIYFKLKAPIPDQDTDPLYSKYSGSNKIDNWFRDHYIRDIDNILFKAEIKLLKATGIVASTDEDRDFVTGYVPIDKSSPGTKYGVVKSYSLNSEYDLGYITLKPAEIKISGGIARKDIHPFRDLAFEFLKQNRSELIYGGNTAVDPQSLFSFIPDVMNMIVGYKGYFIGPTTDYATEIRLDGHSVIRLHVPDGFKYGGGHRVKRLTITDNWKEMTGGNVAGNNYKSDTYGQVYDYTIEENGETISSGVAYEPFVGKEQSALVNYLNYENSRPLQTSNNVMMETPIMMQHYPGAGVGYRKITIKSITTENVDGTGNGNSTQRQTVPITEHEYYTAKDFPVIFKSTDPITKGPGFIPVAVPFYTQFHKRMAVSQGYTLILNDMAGKPKAVSQKTKEGELISQQKFEYYTNADGTELENEVQLMTAEGQYERGRMGIEYDISVVLHEDKTRKMTVNTDFNFMGEPIACLPIPAPIPTTFNMKTTFKTAVVQKVVQKQGIMKSVTVTDGTSTIKTENLIFDALTGEAVLTKTSNEFKDDIYNYAQKANWFYEGMAAAYKNVGASIIHNGSTPGNPGSTAPVLFDAQQGLYDIPSQFDVDDWFYPGDEVWVESTAGKLKAYIMGVESTNNRISLMYLDGTYVTANHLDVLTIIRSGRKNLLNVSAGSIAALDVAYTPVANIGDPANMLDFTYDPVTGNGPHIINASAVKFRDYWPSEYCSFEQVCEDYRICIPPADPQVTNPNNITVEEEVDGQWVQMPTETVTIYGDPCSPTTSEEIYTMCTGVEDGESYTIEVEDAQGNPVTAPYTETGSYCNIPANGVYSYTIPCDPTVNWHDDIVNGNYEVRVLLNQTIISSPFSGGVLTIVSQTSPASTTAHSTNIYARKGVSCVSEEYFDVQYNIGDFMCCTNGCAQDYFLSDPKYQYWTKKNLDTRIRWEVNTASYPNGGLFASSYVNIPADACVEEVKDMIGFMNGALPTGYPASNINWKYKSGTSGAGGCVDAQIIYAERIPVRLGIKSQFENDNSALITASVMDRGSRADCFACSKGNPARAQPPCRDCSTGTFNCTTTQIENWWESKTPHNLKYNDDWYHYAEVSTNYELTGHEVVVENLPVGNHTILLVRNDGGGSYSDGRIFNVFNSSSTLSSPYVNVTLPQGTTQETYTITVKDGAGTVVKTEQVTVEALSVSTEIGVDLVGTGPHPLRIYRDGVLVQEVTTQCLGENAVNIASNCSGGSGNPFVTGTKGHWRSWMAYSYVTERVYEAPSTGKGLRDQGYYADFEPFSWDNTNDPKWTATSRVTKFSPYGQEVENVDALGVYSAAQYDYNDNLLTALASNARFQEIAFDGFETYPRDCESPFYFEDITPVTTEAHTGIRSIAVDVNTPVESKNVLTIFDDAACATALTGYTDVSTFLETGEETNSSSIPNIMRATSEGTTGNIFEPLPQECTCLGRFSPIVGEEYYLSAWVKEGVVGNNNLVNYDASSIRVVFLDGAEQEIGSEDIFTQGRIIEEWQPIKGKFTIPSGTHSIKIVLRHLPTNTYISYFDDIRIHPVDAGMQTYVYNKEDYRISAQLDDNNYATFYIYDEEGKLIKTKKETEEGIKTIQEGRNHTVITNPY